jgi:hypothetical protein
MCCLLRTLALRTQSMMTLIAVLVLTAAIVACCAVISHAFD